MLTAQIGVNNVINVSFRQSVTPDRLLGRMNATFRFLLTGALAVGAAGAGVHRPDGRAEARRWSRARSAIALVWVPTFFSSLRGMRELPA